MSRVLSRFGSRHLCLALPFALGLGACGGKDVPGAGPAGPSAQVKFCNQFFADGQPVDLAMEFGQNMPLRLQVASGACSTAPGAACARVPVGRVPIAVRAGQIELVTEAVDFAEGTAWLFVVRNHANASARGGGRFIGLPLEPEQMCASVDATAAPE